MVCFQERKFQVVFCKFLHVSLCVYLYVKHIWKSSVKLRSGKWWRYFHITRPFINIGLQVHFYCNQNNGEKKVFILMYCLSMLNPTIHPLITDSTPLVNEAHGIWTYVILKLLLWKCVKPKTCLWHCDFHMSKCKFHNRHLHQPSLSSTVLQFAMALLNIYLLTTVTSCPFSSLAIKIFIVLKSKITN